VSPEITIALLTLAGVIFASLFSYLGKRHAKQANDAVNNVHKESPKIYDLAINNSSAIVRVEKKVDKIGDETTELKAWKDSYKDSPWKDGDGVKEWLDKNGCPRGECPNEEK